MTEDFGVNGESFSPTIGRNNFLEHVHRYHLILPLVKDKDVLDIGDIEGSGAAFLARTARSVVGVHSSYAAVMDAQKKYSLENLSFIQGERYLIPLPSNSKDIVISFLGSYDVENFKSLILEAKRVLRKNGTLFVIIKIHSKNNENYNDDIEEKILERIIYKNFQFVSIHDQKVCLGSIIAPRDECGVFNEVNPNNFSSITGLENPEYIMAIASDSSEGVVSLGGVFTQDIKKSEAVMDFLRDEKSEWSDIIMEDLDQIADDLNSLKQKNWISNSPTLKIVVRLLYAKLLYVLSEINIFSKRRRAKFLKSAEKRDLISFYYGFEEFYLKFYERLSNNRVILSKRSNVLMKFKLRVTAIVTSFNHGPYLSQRLDSILSQTYDMIDVIILDDCSTDNSRSVIESYVERYPQRIRAIYNDENSGSVFLQWKKGHSLATGDLVWICESDDFCEPTFVEKLIDSFRDPSVMLAFGRIQFVDSEGHYMAGLDRYREESEAGIWNARIIRPAATWFRAGFGVKNVIANVGGSLWRRFDIPDSTWEEACSFRVMGDWYLYAVVAGGGQIAYEPKAISYFRIHHGNTSGKNMRSRPEYCLEYFKTMQALKSRWEIPEETLHKFLDSCRSVFLQAGGDGFVFDNILNYTSLHSIQKENIHVLIGILSFSFGGGEIFPIHLANALRRKGVMVSLLQIDDSNDHRDVRAMLNPGIPVYTAKSVRLMGIKKFLNDTGISIIHSHVANIEYFFLEGEDISIPYIATLHGSYEAMNIAANRIDKWVERIDKLAYTTNRNLIPFKKLQVPCDKFLKVKNAMPVDHIPFTKNRGQLGIADDAIVFSLVARGVDAKGWVEAVKAYLLLRQRHPDVQMALLLVGKGPAAEAAKRIATADKTIYFLGFVKQIYGLYRMSDVALIPTRFSGESFPLCLIQALQVGVPCVATDIGEIKMMTQIGDKQSGIIIPNNSNDDQFIEELMKAMELILDRTVRDKFASNARTLGEEYDIDILAENYISEYTSIINHKNNK